MPLGASRINTLSRVLATGPTGLAATDPNLSFFLTDTSYAAQASATNSVTLAFWMRMDSTASTGEQTVFRLENGSSSVIFLNVDNGNERIRYGVFNSSWQVDRVFDLGTGVFGDGNFHHIMYARQGSTDYAYVDGSQKTVSQNPGNTGKNNGDAGNHHWDNFSTGIILAESTGGGNKVDNPITQFYLDDGYNDLTSSSVRQKFYNGGAVDMGSDGTSSGLGQPVHFFVGGATDFASDGGTYTDNWTTNGTADTDIDESNGPQFA